MIYKKLNNDSSLIQRDRDVVYSRGGHLYVTIGLIWLTLMTVFEYFTFVNAMHPLYVHGRYIMLGLLIFNQLFVAIFFFFGLQNLVIPTYYALIRRKEAAKEKELLDRPLPKDWHPRVKLLYATYNDFLPYAAAECMDQTYDNTQLVILDNSDDQRFRDMIAQFCFVHPDVQYVRKYPNKGAKAGNLNNYLNGVGKGQFDYFVILDSDELIQPTFVENALKYFYYTDHLGILQGNHISGQNMNMFQEIFANSGKVFWPIQNSVRSSGSAWLVNDYQGTGKPKRLTGGDTVAIELGHGTMVSAAAIQSIGNQMPIAVAEDLCLSFVLLEHGWNVKFSTQIYGNESFPISMNALMIRSTKFCSANFQFFGLYWKALRKSKMFTFTQKLDLLSFTLSVPIFAFEYVSLVLGSIIFPLTHTPNGYVALFLIPTLIMYFSQSIADAAFQLSERHTAKDWWRVIRYELQSGMLYGSFYYSTIKATLLACLGKKAKFNVTPKEADKITIRQALKENQGSILFSLATVVVVLLCSHSSWILMSFVPGMIGWIEAFKSNHQSEDCERVQAAIEQSSIDALIHPERKPIDWDI